MNRGKINKPPRISRSHNKGFGLRACFLRTIPTTVNISIKGRPIIIKMATNEYQPESQGPAKYSESIKGY